MAQLDSEEYTPIGPLHSLIPANLHWLVSKDTLNSYLASNKDRARNFKKKRQGLADRPVIVSPYRDTIDDYVLNNLTELGKEAVEKVNPWIICALIDTGEFDRNICTCLKSDKRKKELLRDIERYCMRYKGKKVETVLMVGRTGVGKSAALNTIAKVVNGEYFPIANVGHGVAQSKTKEFLTFRNCGARPDMERKSTEREEDEIFKRITKYLPHIIDFAGLDDEDTPSRRELFGLLIDGCIPPGTSVAALERDQKKHGVGRLRSIYPNPNPEWKVTKIVFVHSCQQSVPTALIECLLSTLTATREGSRTLRYTGDIFLLITNYDRVDSTAHQAEKHSGRRSSKDNKQNISIEEFLRIESTLAEEFSIAGALEHNRLRFASYCSDTGYDNENVDELSLKLIKLLVMPTTDRDPGQDSVRDALLSLIPLEMSRETMTYFCRVFICVVVGILFFYVWKSLMAQPDSRRYR